MNKAIFLGRDGVINKRFAKEHKLALLAARSKLPSDDIAELIKKGIRWEGVTKYAGRTGILPIVAYNLSSNKEICSLREAVHEAEGCEQSEAITARSPTPSAYGMPEDVKQYLKWVLFMTTAKNLQMYQVLARVVSALQKEGLDVILLRGPVLAATVYPHIGTRAFSDLDLMVRRIDMPKVEKCMEKMDFSMLLENHSSCDLYKKHRHLPFTDGKGSIIEIHWDVEKTIRFSNKSIIRDFWTNAEKKSFELFDVKVLSPEDSLLILCLHNAHHKLSMLSIFSDIDKFVSFYKEKLNWDKFLLTAKKHALSRVAYASLFYVASLFDTDIPQKVLRQLSPRWYVKKILQSEPCSALVLNEGKLDGLHTVTRAFLMERREILFRYIFQNIVPPLEKLAALYKVKDSTLVFIYYIARFFHCLKKLVEVCSRLRKSNRFA